MFETKISTGGRVVIPPAIRRQLGVADGDSVLCVVHDKVVRLTTRQRQLEFARALVQKHVPAGRAPALVDELIQERRNEALNERK
jgi:AbrB family looped-hinge helix DNA binding protein